jgi:hypothetical protein
MTRLEDRVQIPFGYDRRETQLGVVFQNPIDRVIEYYSDEPDDTYRRGLKKPDRRRSQLRYGRRIPHRAQGPNRLRDLL